MAYVIAMVGAVTVYWRIITGMVLAKYEMTSSKA
jgi:hypothetical protein